MPALRTRDTQARSLEVTTDAPQPPTLAIISPTPRAFTFPSTHNLSDSPYSTPSSSPFEPDLRSLALSSTSSSCTTPPPLMRTLTPDSASPASHKRRKSSTSSIASTSPSDVDRRPKKGDEDYVKRPENAFILFRRKCCEERDAAAASSGDKKQRQADLSKAISQQWKALSGEERKYWEGLAKEKKKEHEQLYPNYVYRPQRVRDKDGKARNKKRVKKGSEDLCGEEMSSTVSFVIPPPTTSKPHGRSASAPTPPPSFQTIQIPILFGGSNASCPSSPSLLPMISRRAAYTGNPEDMMRDFDFRPNGAEHLIPPAEYSQYLPHQSIMDPSMFSPSTTCSSGPASPASGPYTPSSSYTHPSAFPSEFSMPPNVEEQCNWGWPSDGSPSLMSSDFDLGAIPPIQLGMTKDHQHLEALPMEMESYSPVYDSQLPSEYGYESQQQRFVEEHPEFSQYSMDMDPSSLLLQGFNGVVDEMPLTTHEAHSSY
ncbi:slightly ste11-like protein [Marasmius crinis-equi]|uniref:Slightly ste11-like protein n=1 Tax=Marasmius crinis-equi TaxID=585013 RepID=A0ABR3EVR7_9AGAR